MDKFDWGNLTSDPQKTTVDQPTWKRLLRKPWFILLVTVIVVGFVGLLSINRIMIALLHSRAEVVVPDLEGKSLMEGLRIVSELDLSLKQDTTEFDEALPAGTILRQHPPAGMQVRTGRAVQVAVSKGGQVVFVPNVIGRPLVEAQSLIQAERLQLGAVNSLYSVDVNEGSVIGQNPSSGTVVTRGALIDLDVSKGLPPSGALTVPDFRGQSSDKAREWAEGANVQFKVVEDPKAMGLAGAVIRQNPSAGQPLLEGDTLRVTVVSLTAQASERFRYTIPSGKGDAVVKLMARDSRGESEIYKGTHKGGDVVALPIAITSTTRIRVYLDDILVEEKVLEP